MNNTKYPPAIKNYTAFDNLQKFLATGNYKYIRTHTNTITIGRNDTCPCGSGKKYKKCCGNI